MDLERCWFSTWSPKGGFSAEPAVEYLTRANEHCVKGQPPDRFVIGVSGSMGEAVAYNRELKRMRKALNQSADAHGSGQGQGSSVEGEEGKGTEGTPATQGTKEKAVPPAETVREAVAAWLQGLGCDGLCNEATGCGCRINDLVPCGEECLKCRPGICRHVEANEACGVDCEGQGTKHWHVELRPLEADVGTGTETTKQGK